MLQGMQIPRNSEASHTWMGGAALRMRQQHCQLLHHPARPYVSSSLLRDPTIPRAVSMTVHFNFHPRTLHVTMTIPIIPNVVPQSSGIGSFARTCGFDALVSLMLRLTLAVQVAGGGNITGGMLAAEFQEALTTDGCGCFAKAPMCPASRLHFLQVKLRQMATDCVPRVQLSLRSISPGAPLESRAKPMA